MTFRQAKRLQFGDWIHHKSLKNADGTPVRARVTGMVKTWKTRPYAIRVPCKYGLYGPFQMGRGETDRHLDQDYRDWLLGDGS